MHIRFETIVTGHYLEVMKRFDRNLFEALKPPGARMDIIKFTGSETGDIVHLRFKGLISAEWISEITDHGQDDNKTYFIDEGRKLPFGLKHWKHRHIVEKVSNDQSRIVDDIHYEGIRKVWSLVLYPGLYLAFYPRKWAYRKYFNQGK